MPRQSHVRVVERLTANGYNVERDAVTLFANADDSNAAVERALEAVDDDALTITVADAKLAVSGATGESSADGTTGDGRHGESRGDEQDPPVSTGTSGGRSPETSPAAPDETKGVEPASPATAGAERAGERSSGGARKPQERNASETEENPTERRSPEDRPALEIANDVTNRSTGTGAYEDFVRVFRDRYERLAGHLGSRVTHRPTDALETMAGGSDAGLIGMVNDIRSTTNGHWLVELEDATGTFPVLVMKDRDIADDVAALLEDEVVGVEGTLSDDGEIVFADAIHFPDVPRTYSPSTADRPVEAALISDVHVGSQEFLAEEWSAFADWLHSEAADRIEYLLVAGDMVEGVGVYPDQDEELDIVDIYDQYERFSEHLKEVPGDLDIVMIPGNHDAVRLAEPQPGFDEELREIMGAHDARITGNPSVVTIEGVSVLMYHGVSLDELVAQLPDELATYDDPQNAMAQLLRKRHLGPPFGGHMRIAPEERDYLVIEEVPDVFHTGHVHKLGVGQYHNVRLVNSGCWQAQTSFQKSVDIVPDTATAPIIDLQTLEVTVRKFN